jgi:hypothetical protein
MCFGNRRISIPFNRLAAHAVARSPTYVAGMNLGLVPATVG